MARHPSRRSAIVADRRPLERGLARFLLEERGLFVVGEAATMADVLLQVQQLKPDIVVLHERLALDHDPTVIAQIRRISPRTSIVLLAANRASLPPELLLLADTVVEDGPGLTELATAVAGPVTATAAAEAQLETGVTTAGAAAVASARGSAGSRWADRLQGLAVASIIALAFVLVRNTTTPSLVPTVEGRAHMVAAWDQLGELESALPRATSAQIAEIASVLIDERAAAGAAGVDLTTFDQALRERLAAIWSLLPLETQALLVALFGEIIHDSDVPPLPSPSPETEPSPSPQPEPSPNSEPEPSPSPGAETTTPPAETTTPPAETTTPPAETTTPPAETTTPPAETTTPPAETTTPPAETTTPPAETTTPPAETTTPPAETTTPPAETTTPPAETTTPPAETTTPPAETTTPPAETTTPPAETTTPPAETTTPPAGETQSGGLVFVPFGLGLLLAITGWTRRRSNAEKQDRSDVS